MIFNVVQKYAYKVSHNRQYIFQISILYRIHLWSYLSHMEPSLNNAFIDSYQAVYH